MRRSLVAVLVVFASLALVTGGVLAGTKLIVPTADGMFWACYDNGGAIRLVADGSQACPKTWSGPVHWAQGSGGGIVTHRVTASGTSPAGDVGEAIAACGAGEVVLGGGYVTTSIHPDVRPFQNQPIELDGIQGWQVVVINGSDVAVDFTAYGICTTGTSTGY